MTVAQPMIRVVHLEKEDDTLACRVLREPDSRTTTKGSEVTCPFCKKGK